MTESVLLARYHASDRDQVLVFLRTVYAADQSARMIRQWDWKYGLNLLNDQGCPYILLAKAEDRIVGMLGAMALRVCVRGKEYSVVNSGDWIVHPDFRGKQIGRLLYQQYIQEQPLSMFWSNSISHPIVRRTWHTQTRRIYPLIALARVSRIFVPAPLESIRISTVEKLDERFDALWQLARNDYTVIGVRDQRFLQWRFFARPAVQYTMLAATHGEHLLGYLVLRLVERKQGLIGYLVDWLVKDQSTQILAHLVRDAVEHANRAGARFVSVGATSPSFSNLFHRLGFAPWLFGSPTYFGVRMDAADPSLLSFGEIRNWFLTMGDGDLELGF